MAKLYKDLRYDTDQVSQPGDPLTSPDGKVVLSANNNGTVTVEAGSEIPETSTLDNLKDNLGLTDSSTLGDVMTSMGLSDSDTLETARQQGGRSTSEVITEKNLPQPDWNQSDSTKKDYIKNKPASFTPAQHSHAVNDITGTLTVAQGGTGATSSSGALSSLGAASVSHKHAASDITSGTLGIARGGTGKASHTVNSVVIGGTSTTGALQNVATANGAFYATAANAKPTFGTLPIAQGGTGSTSAADALTALGAAAADHIHNSLRTSRSTNNYHALSITDSGEIKKTSVILGEPATDTVLQVTGDISGTGFPANKVLAGPVTGTTGVISFRSLVAADLPAHSHSDYLDKTIDNTIYRSIFISDSTADGRVLQVGCVGTNDSGPVAEVGCGNFVAGWNNNGTFSHSTMYANGYMYQRAADESEVTLTFPDSSKSGTIATSVDIATKQDKLPTTSASDVGKVLGVTNSSGTLGWISAGSGGGGGNSKYAIVTPEQTTSGTNVSLILQDQSINQVSLASTVTTATISFPTKTSGYARDFFVRLTITGSTVPAITWQESNGDPIDFDVDDDSWSDIEQGVNILMFTETTQAS